MEGNTMSRDDRTAMEGNSVGWDERTAMGGNSMGWDDGNNNERGRAWVGKRGRPTEGLG